jgi:hypothetical protein
MNTLEKVLTTISEAVQSSNIEKHYIGELFTVHGLLKCYKVTTMVNYNKCNAEQLVNDVRKYFRNPDFVWRLALVEMELDGELIVRLYAETKVVNQFVKINTIIRTLDKVVKAISSNDLIVSKNLTDNMVDVYKVSIDISSDCNPFWNMLVEIITARYTTEPFKWKDIRVSISNTEDVLGTLDMFLSKEPPSTDKACMPTKFDIDKHLTNVDDLFLKDLLRQTESLKTGAGKVAQEILDKAIKAIEELNWLHSQAFNKINPNITVVVSDKINLIISDVLATIDITSLVKDPISNELHDIIEKLVWLFNNVQDEQLQESLKLDINRLVETAIKRY